MEVCQDQVTPFPFSEVERIFLEEFGKPIEHYFQHFETRPFAAASLAQVHQAILHSGQKVAVKVQYPRLSETLNSDLLTIEILTKVVEFFFPNIKLNWILDEIKINIPDELNFEKEAKNCERFNQDFAHLKNVCAPKIFWEVTSPKIITSEFIDGVKISNLEGLRELDADFKFISQLLVDVFCTQIFFNGYVFNFFYF